MVDPDESGLHREFSAKRVAEVTQGIERGWAFTPIKGKRPYRKRWQAEDPVDSATTIEWARQGNIALRTGKISGVVVIDDDTESGVGTAALALPETVTVVTGSGKRHFYFRCPEGGLGNSSQGLPPKVDVRGDGGCIVFPGSIHPETGNAYWWAPGLSPGEIDLAELPESVLAALDQGPRVNATRPPVTNTSLVDLPILCGGDPRPNVAHRVRKYGRGVLNWACRRIAAAAQGSRNETLNRESYAVGRYVACGAIDDSVAQHRLVEAACRAGLGGVEATATVNSGLDAGKREGFDVEQVLERLDDRATDSRASSSPTSGSADASDGGCGDSPGDTTYGTELWFAQRLVGKHGRDLRFVGERKKWFFWSDGEGRWKEDSTGEVQRRAKDIVTELVQEARALESAFEEGTGVSEDEVKDAVSVAKKFQAKTPLENAIQLASTEPTVVATRDQWDSDAWLLNVANGTIDLRTGRLREHRRRDYITKRCPVAFQADAPAPTWMVFLERIFPDPDIRDYVTRFLGYCLTGDVGEHVLHVLWGLGANGKSTLLEAIRFVLGDYGVTAPPTLLMQAKGDKHPTEQTMLCGARLAVSTETPEGGRLDENTMKSLTGGDTITARGMRENFWSFAPTHKLVVATNHRPRVVGNDEGVWRRLRLIPFLVTIPEDERDPALLDKLKAEAPGILTELLAGLRAYKERRLSPPHAVRVATDEYRESEDSLGEFIEDCLEVASGGFLPSQTLLRAYRDWCGDQGIPESRRLSARTLTIRLKERGYDHSRSSRCKGFDNLRLVHGGGFSGSAASMPLRAGSPDEAASRKPHSQGQLMATSAAMPDNSCIIDICNLNTPYANIADKWEEAAKRHKAAPNTADDTGDPPSEPLADDEANL